MLASKNWMKIKLKDYYFVLNFYKYRMYCIILMGPLYFLLGSDDDWKVDVPPCVGEPLCDVELVQDETVESSTGMPCMVYYLL